MECAHCGRDFPPKKSVQKFCGRKCASVGAKSKGCYSVEPLLPILANAMEENVVNIHRGSFRFREGRRQMARILAVRCGTRERSEERQLHRVFSGQVTHLTERYADRIACALGYHPAEIWGQQWWGVAS